MTGKELYESYFGSMIKLKIAIILFRNTINDCEKLAFIILFSVFGYVLHLSPVS